MCIVLGVSDVSQDENVYPENSVDVRPSTATKSCEFSRGSIITHCPLYPGTHTLSLISRYSHSVPYIQVLTHCPLYPGAHVMVLIELVHSLI